MDTTDTVSATVSTAGVTAGHGAALAGLDPLLPPPGVLAVEDGALLLTARAGESVAAGVARTVTAAADSEAALWGSLRNHRLTAQLAGPDRRAAMAALLDVWEPVLRERAAPGDDDGGATVTIASRDTDAALPLIRHGFAPLIVVAVRRRLVGVTSAPPALSGHPGVRLMAEGDLDAVAALAVELHVADAAFGMVTERPGEAELLRSGVADQWRRAPGHTWVAVAGSTVVGFAQVQPAAEAGWVAGLVAGPAPAYFGYLYVRPGSRGTGLGSALVAAAHAAIDADAVAGSVTDAAIDATTGSADSTADAAASAGDAATDGAAVATTLLHHALPSPYSMPFWARQGYRPLWTAYQRRPAVG